MLKQKQLFFVFTFFWFLFEVLLPGLLLALADGSNLAQTID